MTQHRGPADRRLDCSIFAEAAKTLRIRLSMMMCRRMSMGLGRYYLAEARNGLVSGFSIG